MNFFIGFFTDGRDSKYLDRFILGVDYKRIKGGRYRLLKDAVVECSGIRGTFINNEYLRLEPSGYTVLKKGFECDGPSSIMIDTPSAMRAAFFHDGFYRAFIEEFLRVQSKTGADLLFYRLLIDDGCWEWRAKKACKAVSGLGYSSCIPSHKNMYTVR